MATEQPPVTSPLNVLAPPADWELEPSKTALLVVDVQYLDADPNAGMGLAAKRQGIENHFVYYWKAVERMLPRIRQLQDACRAKGVEVIHLRLASATADCRDISMGQRIRKTFAPPGSKEAEFLPDVKPLPGEIVISKTSSSAFNSTAIDQTLRNLGVEYLIACGVVTNGCVDLTVRDAADRNYRVIVAHDACAAMSPQLHEAALLCLDGFVGMVKVRSTEDTLKLLERTPQTAGAKR